MREPNFARHSGGGHGSCSTVNGVKLLLSVKEGGVHLEDLRDPGTALDLILGGERRYREEAGPSSSSCQTPSGTAPRSVPVARRCQGQRLDSSLSAGEDVEPDHFRAVAASAVGAEGDPGNAVGSDRERG